MVEDPRRQAYKLGDLEKKLNRLFGKNVAGHLGAKQELSRRTLTATEPILGVHPGYAFLFY